MTQQVKDFFKAATGPLSDLREIADKLPSEESINRLLEALPTLERLANNSLLEKVARLSVLADFVEQGKLDAVMNLEPLLANMPSNTTLVDIANLKPYLASLPSREELRMLAERLPTREEREDMVAAMKELKEFLVALKG